MNHPHAAVRTASTTFRIVSSPSGFMGMTLPLESSNPEMSMALPTAWALSLPLAAPLRLQHSYPGPVRTARRSMYIRPAINGATKLLSQVVSRSANWQETTGSSGRWTSVTVRARAVTDLRRTGSAGGLGGDRHRRDIEPYVGGAKTCQAGLVILRGIVCLAGLFLIPVLRGRCRRRRRSSAMRNSTRPRNRH